MYAKATFLSQQHKFLFMYKCINHNIIVCFKIFLILYGNYRFLGQRKQKYIENRKIITYIFKFSQV
jgi:hypothetical protein